MATSHQLRVPRMGQPAAYQDAAFIYDDDLVLRGNPGNPLRNDPPLFLHGTRLPLAGEAARYLKKGGGSQPDKG